jgi:hypothetical protein
MVKYKSVNMQKIVSLSLLLLFITLLAIMIGSFFRKTKPVENFQDEDKLIIEYYHSSKCRSSDCKSLKNEISLLQGNGFLKEYLNSGQVQLSSFDITYDKKAFERFSSMSKEFRFYTSPLLFIYTADTDPILYPSSDFTLRSISDYIRNHPSMKMPIIIDHYFHSKGCSSRNCKFTTEILKEDAFISKNIKSKNIRIFTHDLSQILSNRRHPKLKLLREVYSKINPNVSPVIFIYNKNGSNPLLYTGDPSAKAIYNYIKITYPDFLSGIRYPEPGSVEPNPNIKPLPIQLDPISVEPNPNIKPRPIQLDPISVEPNPNIRPRPIQLDPISVEPNPNIRPRPIQLDPGSLPQSFLECQLDSHKEITDEYLLNMYKTISNMQTKLKNVDTECKKR